MTTEEQLAADLAKAENLPTEEETPVQPTEESPIEVEEIEDVDVSQLAIDSLIAVGWTYNEQTGELLPPEPQAAKPAPAVDEPVVPAVPVSPAVEKPAPAPAVAPTPTPQQESPDGPAEYKGWLLAPSGADLYEPALEDPNSPEAQVLIHGDDENEGIGEAEYAKLQGEYRLDKINFAREQEYADQQAIQNGMVAFRKQAEDFSAAVVKFAEEVGDPADAVLGNLKPYTDQINTIIREAHTILRDQLVKSGLPLYRADQRAQAILLAESSLYEDALGEAIKRDWRGFYKSAKAAAKPPVAAAPSPSPRPIPVPVAAPSQSAAPATGTVKITRAEAEIAKSLGWTAAQWAERRSKLKD